MAEQHNHLRERTGEASTSRDDDEDDTTLEQDPSHRFSRYNQTVGSGRFKRVFKGFDEKRGVDIAWSRIPATVTDPPLDDEAMEKITAEMSKGLALEHPNIIRCYRCWHDTGAHCINLITEFFTSGNLRDYRQRHKHLELKAVRKWARQILSGLDYLHLKQPPVIHGDLRCDKIYINGHSGEIKIGDLGLATLLPKRFAPSVLPAGSNPEDQYTRSVDIFAFGLCVLELATLQRMDRDNAAAWPDLVATVSDPDARAFIQRCLGPAELRPTTVQLLEDAFFHKKPPPAPAGVERRSSAQLLEPQTSAGPGSNYGGGGPDGYSSAGSGALHSSRGEPSAHGGAAYNNHHEHQQQQQQQEQKEGREDRERHEAGEAERERRTAEHRRRTSGADAGSSDEAEACEVGTVRGEDYDFQFSGRVREGKLHFRLNMEYCGDDDDDGNEQPPREPPDPPRHRRTIDFAYDPDVDTPEEIADEITSEFELSSTDRDICAAALKEWLAKELPDNGSS